VYGARNNIQIAAGNVTIQNTVVECGSLSNIHIKSSEGNTVTLDNVTTIQRKVEDGFGVGNMMLGFGILVGDNESTTYPTIKITGDLKQYNWAGKEDAKAVSNTYAQQAINNAVSNTNYVHTFDGVAKINLGMVFLTTNSTNIQDNRSDTVKTQVPYDLGTVTISGYSGQVYSVKKGSQVTKDSRYDATVDGVIPYTPNAQNTIAPQVAHSGVNGSSLTINTAFDKEWITTFTADLDNITGGSYSFKFSDLIIECCNRIFDILKLNCNFFFHICNGINKLLRSLTIIFYNRFCNSFSICISKILLSLLESCLLILDLFFKFFCKRFINK
jgi:hypothetical protein